MSKKSDHVYAAAHLLAQMFSVQEWKVFINKDYRNLADEMPLSGASMSKISYFNEVTDILCRHGMLDVDFCDALVRERPRRSSDIEQLREALNGERRTEQTRLVFNCTREELTLDVLAKLLETLREMTATRQTLVINVEPNAVTIDTNLKWMRRGDRSELEARIEGEFGFELIEIASPKYISAVAAKESDKPHRLADNTEWRLYREEMSACERTSRQIREVLVFLERESRMRIPGQRAESMPDVSATSRDEGVATIESYSMLRNFFNAEQLLYFISVELYKSDREDDDIKMYRQSSLRRIRSIWEQPWVASLTLEDVVAALLRAGMVSDLVHRMTEVFSSCDDGVKLNLLEELK